MMTIHLNLNAYALAPKCQVDNLLCAWDFKLIADKKQSALAPKCQVDNLCGWDFNVVMLTHYLYFQAELSKKYSQITDLQRNIKSKQEETWIVKSELTTALTTMEQLKEFFKGERADWETEKATLLKRAEDAENALKPATEELSSLKRQIDAMTSAIFGNNLFTNM